MGRHVLTFDEETHKYTLDGKPVASVTSYLDPFKDFSMVDPRVLERASRFGKAVHKMVELHLLGRLDYGSVDEGLLGCLAAFEKWLAEVRPFERITGGAVIDVKSRKPDKNADPLQLAAYYQLYQENREELGDEIIIERPLASVIHGFAGTPDIIIPPRDGRAEFTERRVLYLGRDGNYTFKPAYDRNAWPVFAHLLKDRRQREATASIIQGWKRRV